MVKSDKPTFAQIKKEDKRIFSKIITERDIKTFAEITGDINPLHLNSEIAHKTIFGGKLVHGILVAGLISTAISNFPGVVVYISQTLEFCKPVRVGDKIKAIAIVMEKIDVLNELKLQTSCINQRGEKVITGEARIRILET